MKLLRIIDNDTKIYLRDDFIFFDGIESGVQKEIPDTLYAVPGVCPVWNGIDWYQNVGKPIEESTPPEPTLEERVTTTEDKIVTVEQAIDVIFGGV